MPPSPAGHQRIPGLARTLIAFFAGAFLSVLFPPAAFATAPALAPTNVTAYDASTYACDSALHSVAVHTSEVAVVVPLGVSRGAQGTAAMLTEPFSLPSRLSVAADSGAGLTADIAQTFKGGGLSASTTAEDVLLTRYYGGDSQPLGQFWTRTAYSSPGRAQQYLALPPGNTAVNTITIRIPAGTTIYEGQAAGVEAWGEIGGGNQVFIPHVDPAWIVP